MHVKSFCILLTEAEASIHYGKRLLCRVSKTLGKRPKLCRVLHSAKDTRKRKYRQRGLCRVHFVGHSAKPLPSAKSRTRQRLLLCRVQTLGKVTRITHFNLFFSISSTHIYQKNTRQTRCIPFIFFKNVK
jgi:hypothetical protein